MSPIGRHLLLVVPLGLGMAACEHGMFKTEHGGVEEGNQALVEGRAEEAVEQLAEAAGHIPESPELCFDRGLALSAARRHDEATQMLLRGLDTRDKTLRGKLHAALGSAYSRWGLDIERSGVDVPAPSQNQGAIDGPMAQAR